MALNKLPCEDKEACISKTRECFKGLTDRQKNNLLKAFERTAERLEELKWKRKAGK